MASIDNISIESDTDNSPADSLSKMLEVGSIGYNPPLYDTAVVKLQFNTDTEFQEWMSNVASTQGIWHLKNNYYKVNPEREELLAEGRFLKNSQTYCCDCYGTPRKPRQKETFDENNEIIVKKKRKRGPSKKVSCRAHFCKKLFTNGQVEVLYHWQHVNHDPFKDINAKIEKKRKVPDKGKQIQGLKQGVLDEVKSFEKTVNNKLEVYKENPPKLKGLKEVLKKGFEDLSKTMDDEEKINDHIPTI